MGLMRRAEVGYLPCLERAVDITSVEGIKYETLGKWAPCNKILIFII